MTSVYFIKFKIPCKCNWLCQISIILPETTLLTLPLRYVFIYDAMIFQGSTHTKKILSAVAKSMSFTKFIGSGPFIKLYL